MEDFSLGVASLPNPLVKFFALTSIFCQCSLFTANNVASIFFGGERDIFANTTYSKHFSSKLQRPVVMSDSRMTLSYTCQEENEDKN